jgi:hypothetical protein
MEVVCLVLKTGVQLQTCHSKSTRKLSFAIGYDAGILSIQTNDDESQNAVQHQGGYETPSYSKTIDKSCFLLFFFLQNMILCSQNQ